LFLIDSLDRMTDLQDFTKLIEQDVAAITSTGAGVVVTGPVHAIYGLQRLIAERFDQFVSISAVDAAHDKEAMPFLVEILRQRVPDEIMGIEMRLALAGWSGGVLRDLIHLGRLALEEAYVSGEERISAQHVERAADAFGRTLMIGLTQDDLKVLQRVRVKGAFVETSEEDLALLATRRVLEYRNTGVRHAVHPTIAPLLAQLEGG
jgi:cell division ATPase FtsA